MEAVGRAFRHTLNLSYGDIGSITIDNHGILFTDEVWSMPGVNDAVLFGPVAGPKWDALHRNRRPDQGLLDIRPTWAASPTSGRSRSTLGSPTPVPAPLRLGARLYGGGAWTHRWTVLSRAVGSPQTPSGIVVQDTMRYT